MCIFYAKGDMGFILCKLAKIGVRVPVLPVGNNFQKAVRNSGDYFRPRNRIRAVKARRSKALKVRNCEESWLLFTMYGF